MQTLLEQYNEIYQKISQLNSMIADYNEEIESLTSKRDEEIPTRIANLKEQLAKIDEYELKVNGFLQLAEKHMISKNLPAIEAPENYRVNLNRLRLWATLIDPMVEDDVYAQKIYLVGNCDLRFLDKKKAEFSDRIVELDNDYNVGAPEQLKELNLKIDNVKEQIREFLAGEVVSNFADSVRKGNDERRYLDTPVEFREHDKEPEYWIPGAYGTAIDVVEEQRGRLKTILGSYFDENTSKVYLPLERIPAEEEFAMTVSCVPARKKMNEMDAGIRNLLFQIIDKSPAGSRKIYIIDALRENSALIGGLKGLEGTAVVEQIPRNDEMVQQTLESIVASFSDIDDVLENYDTVKEYNEAMPAEKRIQRSVIVIVGWPNEFNGENAEYAQKIFSNYERYGISFIAVKVSTGKDKEVFGFSDYVGENVINISMTMSETTIKIGQEAEHAFAWYPFKYQLPFDYCNAIRSISHGKGKKVTDYAERGLLQGGINYTRGLKKLELPYGVDGKDELHKIVFENENFASFLMGASGSGKSTFLHSLITGIIKNYHPDDVELWLADFKMSEFAQYINPMPPHVKYILLDESQELVFDLIDKLTEKMMERQRFFMKNRELKKVESVPTNTYMPVIFVILDEFSIMSQAIEDHQDYRLKLQNLLAKGRALGIKFLFSSQTFTTGIKGLTPTAKAQIQMRVAMKAAKQEITETLELSSAQKTDQVQNWIDALPVYHALIKYRDRSDGEDKILVRRTTVLYFDDKDSKGDPYKKQRELILEAKEKVHKTDSYNPSELYVYADKHPVVVDGNSYDMYREDYFTEGMASYRKANDVSDDEMLLAFGRPRLMSDMQLVSVTQESRENFLLFAPPSERACVTSVLVSMIKQFKLQNSNIEIWTYSKSKLYKAYADIFAKLGCKVVEDVAGISASVKKLKEDIDKKVVGNALIILLGMERICGDFGYGYSAPAASVNEAVSEPAPAPAPAEDPYEHFSEKDWKMTKYADLWPVVEEKVRKKNKKKSKEEIEAKLSEERNKLVAQICEEWDNRSVNKPAEEPGDTKAESTETEAVTESPAETVVSESYNASSDFKAIVQSGSRYGYHFAMYLANYTDLKATSFAKDWFRHRLSFQMAADDSRDFLGSKVASLLPEHVCQYSDLMDSHSFRPYLHQGIEWDGWGVSDAGELISPFAKEEE